jgi:hypothetical protein
LTVNRPTIQGFLDFCINSQNVDFYSQYTYIEKKLEGIAKYYTIILNVLIWLVGFIVLSAIFNSISGILVTMTYTGQ